MEMANVVKGRVHGPSRSRSPAQNQSDCSARPCESFNSIGDLEKLPFRPNSALRMSIFSWTYQLGLRENFLSCLDFERKSEFFKGANNGGGIVKFKDLFVPRYLHSDPDVRLNFVMNSNDAKLLQQMSEKDTDEKVRKAAAERATTLMAGSRQPA